MCSVVSALMRRGPRALGIYPSVKRIFVRRYDFASWEQLQPTALGGELKADLEFLRAVASLRPNNPRASPFRTTASRRRIARAAKQRCQAQRAPTCQALRYCTPPYLCPYCQSARRRKALVTAPPCSRIHTLTLTTDMHTVCRRAVPWQFQNQSNSTFSPYRPVDGL